MKLVTEPIESEMRAMGGHFRHQKQTRLLVGFYLSAFIVGLVLSSSYQLASAADEVKIGMCWGRNSWQSFPPKVVVNLMKDNGIKKLKLFSADADILRALVGSDLEVAVMVSNEFLSVLASSAQEAEKWVSNNISPFMFPGGVNIKYIAVGNEPFLAGYAGAYDSVMVPALQNIWNAVQKLQLQGKVTVTVPLNLDILSVSYPPSKAALRADISTQVRSIAKILNDAKGPFAINIYPFLTLYQQPPGNSLPLSVVLVDMPSNLTNSSQLPAGSFVDPGTNLTYTNIFDGAYDSVVTMLGNIGYPDLEVQIGEIGWPSDGQNDTRGYATVQLAQLFTNQIIHHMSRGVGTPLRPGQDIPGYLFSLTDEDRKGIENGAFERHWGIFRSDGTPKYMLDLTGQGRPSATLASAHDLPLLPAQWCVSKPDASDERLSQAVSYACGDKQVNDCTAALVGGSCYFNGNLKNISSYVFNQFYQLNNQSAASCDFGGVAQVVTTNPSSGNCTFLRGIDMRQAKPASALLRPTRWMVSLLVAVLALLVCTLA